MMTWQLEGENYLVQLPDFNMMCRLFYPKNGITENVPEFESDKFLVFRRKNAIDYIYAMERNNPQGNSEIVLSHFTNASPNDLVKWTLGLQEIHVMLIPLDKDGRPISWELKQQFRNGYSISIGYLTSASSVKVRTKWNKLNANLVLCDNGDQNLRVDWFYCDGCLISKKPIFRDTVRNAWKAMYTI